MQNWIKENLWGLVIAAITFTVAYTTLGNRVSALEADAATARETVNTDDQTLVQLQITTAKIETDVSYIKQQINRVYPPVN